MKGGFFCIAVFFLVGCAEIKKFEMPMGRYANKYMMDEINTGISREEKINGSFIDYPLNDLWRIVPQNVSYAFSEELREKKITMEVNDINISQFFALISQQLGVDYTQDENIFYLGKIDVKQFSVFVSRLDGYDDREIKSIIDGIKSNEGKTTYIKGGVFMLQDRWASIQRLNSVLRKINSLRLKNYDLNLWIVSESTVRSFYMKHGLSGRYSMEWMAGHLISYSNWSLMVSALADWSLNIGDSLGVRQFSAMVQDGKEFKFSSGEKVPVLKKTVSDNGTVSTIGVEYIDVGNVINSRLSRIDDFTVNLEVSCEISSSERQIEDYPVKLASKYETNINIKHGDVVIVGRYDYSIEKKHVLGRESEKSSFYVVCSLNVRN